MLTLSISFPSGRSGHSAVTLSDGTVVLMGGNGSTFSAKNDVWKSPDGGKTWLLATSNSAWRGKFLI